MAEVLESRLTVDTRGFDLGGDAKFKDDQIFLQDAARTTELAILTVVSRYQSTQKLIPLTDINPALTAALLTCGANGGNVAAYAAVADGEFAIAVDGTLINVTGLDFNTVAVTALQQVEEVINAASGGLFRCEYDLATDTFLFYSNKTGLPASTITVLTAVAAGAGTDISGAGFLNGLTTVGVVTAATGETSTSIPAGLYGGNGITAASLVAGDVLAQKLIVGSDWMVDEDRIVLENSLTLASVIAATGKTIREHLQDMGIYPTKSQNDKQIAPI